MNKIEIKIENKIATVIGSPVIVCGNSDYKAVFNFDSEWREDLAKTARFSFTRNGESLYEEKVFTGSECDIPILRNINEVRIGVFTNGVYTTTPAIIRCEKSITCADGITEEPPEDVYDQIVELCNEAVATANDVKTRADNGEFNGKDGVSGKDGEDYILTDNDKQEIANIVLGNFLNVAEVGM